MESSELIRLVLTIYLLLLALILGSFINLAADRLPRGESIIRPRSHCRACERPLNIADLLPVAGYLIRGGRCATCRVPIGIGAPLVELACGIAMLAPVLVIGPFRGAVLGLLLIAAIGVSAVSVSWRRLRA